jgi:hypothetical protein
MIARSWTCDVNAAGCNVDEARDWYTDVLDGSRFLTDGGVLPNSPCGRTIRVA